MVRLIIGPSDSVVSAARHRLPDRRPRKIAEIARGVQEVWAHPSRPSVAVGGEAG
jgi:hypothetical protein